MRIYVDRMFYSAEEVITHIDTLIAEYQYNNPEHIIALVIASNLDYITAEDLDIILATYGYTMEELATLYEECLLNSCNSFVDTYHYYRGMNESVSKSQKYDNRVTLSSVMLDDEDKLLASEVDTNLLGGCHNDSDCYSKVHDFCDTTPNSNAEKVMISFAYTTCTAEISEYNPYNEY